jgi:hypothetical protein
MDDRTISAYVFAPDPEAAKRFADSIFLAVNSLGNSKN